MTSSHFHKYPTSHTLIAEILLSYRNSHPCKMYSRKKKHHHHKSGHSLSFQKEEFEERGEKPGAEGFRVPKKSILSGTRSISKAQHCAVVHTHTGNLH
jgi:hypothetical protein